jgi:hypothetical protein
MKRMAVVGLVCLAGGCGSEQKIDNGGAGGSTAQGATNATATGVTGSASAAGSGGTGGATSVCKPGGEACASFDECCSGSCAGGMCAPCAGHGTACGEGCCVGLTCYAGKCGACGDDGAPCQGSDNCCSTVCTQGVCEPLKCDPPQTSCGAYCATLVLDASNCGSCGKVCNDGESCCYSTCVDLASNNNHCSFCGNDCDLISFCDQGQCLQDPKCCEDGVNIGQGDPSAPPLDAEEVAWAFTPTCSITITNIGLFTDSGFVRLYSDSNGAPGPLHINGLLPNVSPPQWTYYNTPIPLQLNAGDKYWISHRDEVAPKASMSYATGGVPVPFKYVGGGDGQGLRPYAAHIIGDCNP